MNIPRTSPDSVEIPLDEIDNTIVMSPGDNAIFLWQKAQRLLQKRNDSQKIERQYCDEMSKNICLDGCSNGAFDKAKEITEKYGIKVKILGAVVNGAVEGSTLKAYEHLKTQEANNEM